ncbi:radical SAM protein [Vulcanisaeta sp. JCM 14467]
MPLHSIYIAPTYGCIDKCKVCPVYSKRFDRPTILKVEDIVNNIRKKLNLIKRNDANALVRVEISGGEPLLYPYIFELLEELCSINDLSYISILSNLELVKKSRNIIRLKKLKEKCSKGIIFVTTYYSYKPEIHDYISGRNGSFMDKTEGARILLDMKFRVHFKTLITKYNYEYDSLIKLLDFLINKFGDSIPLTFSIHGLDIVDNALKNVTEIAVEYSKSIPHIEKFLDYIEESGLYHKVKITLFSIPLCMLDPYYWKYAGVSETITIYPLYMDAHGNTIEDSSLRELPSPKCDICLLKSYCPKPWRSYVDYFGDRELKPIIISQETKG